MDEQGRICLLEKRSAVVFIANGRSEQRRESLPSPLISCARYEVRSMVVISTYFHVARNNRKLLEE
jgi:hypothetical protein